jgi:hypothetical protein
MTLSLIKEFSDMLFCNQFYCALLDLYLQQINSAPAHNERTLFQEMV